MTLQYKRIAGVEEKLQNHQFGLDIAFADDLLVNESEMSLWVPFASGVRRDGVGDLLEIGGIDTSRHIRNPVVLFDHGKAVQLPVGMSEDPDTKQYRVVLDPVAKIAKGKAYFYQGSKDMEGVGAGQVYEHALFCEQLFDLVVKRFIRAGSIGYQVKTARRLPADFNTGTPEGLHLISVLMLEFSVVVMPANADTVGKVLSLDKICGKRLSPYLVKSLAPYAPPRKAMMGYEGKARTPKQYPGDPPTLPGEGYNDSRNWGPALSKPNPNSVAGAETMAQLQRDTNQISNDEYRQRMAEIYRQHHGLDEEEAEEKNLPRQGRKADSPTYRDVGAVPRVGYYGPADEQADLDQPFDNQAGLYSRSTYLPSSPDDPNTLAGHFAHAQEDGHDHMMARSESNDLVTGYRDDMDIGERGPYVPRPHPRDRKKSTGPEEWIESGSTNQLPVRNAWIHAAGGKLDRVHDPMMVEGDLSTSRMREPGKPEAAYSEFEDSPQHEAYLRRQAEAARPQEKPVDYIPPNRGGKSIDKLSGGLADDKQPQDFDPAQLKAGIRVEMEHTDDPRLAREIAMDHLLEDPAYYQKLSRMEGKSVKAWSDELSNFSQGPDYEKHRDDILNTPLHLRNTSQHGVGDGPDAVRPRMTGQDRERQRLASLVMDEITNHDLGIDVEQAHLRERQEAQRNKQLPRQDRKANRNPALRRDFDDTDLVNELDQEQPGYAANAEMVRSENANYIHGPRIERNRQRAIERADAANARELEKEGKANLDPRQRQFVDQLNQYTGQELPDEEYHEVPPQNVNLTPRQQIFMDNLERMGVGTPRRSVKALRKLYGSKAVDNDHNTPKTDLQRRIMATEAMRATGSPLVEEGRVDPREHRRMMINPSISKPAMPTSHQQVNIGVNGMAIGGGMGAGITILEHMLKSKSLRIKSLRKMYGTKMAKRNGESNEEYAARMNQEEIENASRQYDQRINDYYHAASVHSPHEYHPEITQHFDEEVYRGTRDMARAGDAAERNYDRRLQGGKAYQEAVYSEEDESGNRELIQNGMNPAINDPKTPSGSLSKRDRERYGQHTNWDYQPEREPATQNMPDHQSQEFGARNQLAFENQPSREERENEYQARRERYYEDNKTLPGERLPVPHGAEIHRNTIPPAHRDFRVISSKSAEGEDDLPDFYKPKEPVHPPAPVQPRRYYREHRADGTPIRATSVYDNHNFGYQETPVIHTGKEVIDTIQSNMEDTGITDRHFREVPGSDVYPHEIRQAINTDQEIEDLREQNEASGRLPRRRTPKKKGLDLFSGATHNKIGKYTDQAFHSFETGQISEDELRKRLAQAARVRDEMAKARSYHMRQKDDRLDHYNQQAVAGKSVEGEDDLPDFYKPKERERPQPTPEQAHQQAYRDVENARRAVVQDLHNDKLVDDTYDQRRDQRADRSAILRSAHRARMLGNLPGVYEHLGRLPSKEETLQPPEKSLKSRIKSLRKMYGSKARPTSFGPDRQKQTDELMTNPNLTDDERTQGVRNIIESSAPLHNAVMSFSNFEEIHSDQNDDKSMDSDQEEVATKPLKDGVLPGLKRNKRSINGDALLYVDEKDIPDVRKKADELGLKIHRITGNTPGYVRMRLQGNDNDIDTVASVFGKLADTKE